MSDKIVVLNKGCIEQIGSPEQIYFQPKNRFVADFIGAANILPAKVSHTDTNNLYRVECELGIFITQSDTAPISENIYICWRPESAHAALNDDENQFQIQVENLAFLGNVTDLFGRAADEPSGQKIRIQLHQKMTCRAGDKVSFQLPRNAIRFWRRYSRESLCTSYSWLRRHSVLDGQCSLCRCRPKFWHGQPDR